MHPPDLAVVLPFPPFPSPQILSLSSSVSEVSQASNSLKSHRALLPRSTSTRWTNMGHAHWGTALVHQTERSSMDGDVELRDQARGTSIRKSMEREQYMVNMFRDNSLMCSVPHIMHALFESPARSICPMVTRALFLSLILHGQKKWHIQFHSALSRSQRNTTLSSKRQAHHENMTARRCLISSNGVHQLDGKEVNDNRISTEERGMAHTSST
ncbi:hypothetical protein L210DRAFT_3548901 [Boletus edulis BED1]|uniref:Uncharacterized protein n=1 Tax=Boletus edulis BED1 TaxID=1328754 RepID=A0AAD4BQJ5_BOLED|nr:hypothetical protein L210DRAFT_3548901 [Boletus edulis BED1]